MLASFSVLTQREVLHLFIPHSSWVMEEYPHQRQVHSGQHDKLVCQISGFVTCLSLQMPFQEKIYLLVPLATPAAYLWGKEMFKAAATSQADTSLWWEHSYAGDAQHDRTQQKVVVAQAAWLLSKVLSGCASPGHCPSLCRDPPPSHSPASTTFAHTLL